METFGKRLFAIYNELPCNKSDFAKELGMKPQAINAYLKENGSVFGGELLAIFSEKFPQFNIIWLLTGKGEMYNAGFSPPKKSEGSGEKFEEFQAMVEGMQNTISKMQSKIDSLENGMRWLRNQMNGSRADSAELVGKANTNSQVGFHTVAAI